MSKFLKDPKKDKEEYIKRKKTEMNNELNRLSYELINKLELNKSYCYAFPGFLDYDEQIKLLERFIMENGDEEYGFYITREPTYINIMLVKYEQLEKLKDSDTYDYGFGVIKDFIKTYNIIEKEADKLYQRFQEYIETEEEERGNNCFAVPKYFSNAQRIDMLTCFIKKYGSSTQVFYMNLSAPNDVWIELISFEDISNLMNLYTYVLPYGLIEDPNLID
jgi:hypothetical protein